MKINKGDFLAIESCGTNDKPLSDCEVLKLSFDSVEGLQGHIKGHSMRVIEADKGAEFKQGRDTTWGSSYIIVQVVKIVRPVPVATIKMELMEVK